ncbi:MAG: DUF2017 family protein [Actinomycetota bacterium]
MKGFQVRVKRTRRGDFELHLPPEERDILRALPRQLRELMSSDDPAVERLFPPAYPDEPDLQSEYDRLVRGDLMEQRLGSVEVLERTIEAKRVNEDELLAWLSALNDLRLVLGTKLGATEEDDPEEISDADPLAPSYALYYYLGWLEEQVVEALAGGLDPRGRD